MVDVFAAWSRRCQVKEAGSNESSLWLDHVHSVAIILQAATYGRIGKRWMMRVPGNFEGPQVITPRGARSWSF